MILKIKKPNDFHHHLRDKNMLPITVKHCFNKFKNVIVMPNLVPPIITIKDAISNFIIKCYEKNITNLRPAKGFRATYEEVEAPKENKTKTSTNKTATTKTT